MLLGRVVDIVHALAHVDVEAGEAVVRLDHAVERLVRQREECVPAKHGSNHVGVLAGRPAGKVGVLLNGLIELLLAVTVRDLIAQAGTHAHLLRHVLDGKEGAGDLAEACVVIEDGGHAIAERLHHGHVRAGTRAIEREVTVDVPPLLLEVLEEVGGVAALDGKAARQTGVDVGVAVDKTGHDKAAVGIDELCRGVGGIHLGTRANCHDLVVVDDNGTVLDEGHLGVPGYDPTVSNK